MKRKDTGIRALACDADGKAVEVKARKLKPSEITAAALGVRAGMGDKEVERAIDAATTGTIPPQGEAAVAELRATANAIAHLNTRVAAQLRQLAAELEGLGK